MDIPDIRKIIEMMKEHELSEFELEDEGFRIAIKRRNGLEQSVVTTDGPPAVQVVAPGPAAAQPAAAPAAESSPAGEQSGEAPEDRFSRITSPMVGTFYRASAPDADPFVNVGSEVSEDTVVCIIEAMKVMNEIKAEVSGVIREVLIENSAPVQFGQPLFLIEPA
jgi:acetyl-CoA carboxylase biotin carboxyl carrier protein